MDPLRTSVADNDLVGTSEPQVTADQLVHQIKVGTRRAEQPNMISKLVAIGFEVRKSGATLDSLLLNSRQSNQAIRPKSCSKKELSQNRRSQRLGQKHANNVDGRSRVRKSQHGGAAFGVR